MYNGALKHVEMILRGRDTNNPLTVILVAVLLCCAVLLCYYQNEAKSSCLSNVVGQVSLPCNSSLSCYWSPPHAQVSSTWRCKETGQLSCNHRTHKS